MKGTFFSSDFVRDNNGDLRLLEINTDTSSGYNAVLTHFDYTDFINILSSNNITEVVIVYKVGLHTKLVEHLTQVLNTSAPFITTITPVIIPGDSIFPTSPADSESKFILRMAYDETAILDSEYAKGTLNLLKLFVDNEDESSIVNFYHSSTENGVYNTLDTSVVNGTNIPDLVVKPTLVNHKAFPFYKLGKSDLTSQERYADFITEVATSDNLIEQYHVNSTEIDNNYVSSIRSFKIVYGPNLDICDVGEYEADALFEIPTTITINDTVIANELDIKHYYEFATNAIKNEKHGLLGEETVVDNNGNEIPISTMVEGDTYPSYFVNGSPNTDDDDLLDVWSYSGNTLPDGSYSTTSVLVYLFEWDAFANEITKIVFPNDEFIRIGGGTRLLAYDSISDSIKYVPCNKLTTDYSIFDASGNLVPIVDVLIEILETSEKLYSPNMEDVDTFLVGGSKIIRLVSHNIIRGSSCFPAGTRVTMEDGSDKNIEDVIVGDVVISFNEETKVNEPKKVIGLKQPIHNDMVKYTFANQTEVVSTFDHPYYVNGLDLASYAPELTTERYELGREITKIKVGDMVIMSNGVSNTAIKSIEELPAEDTQTYIISVEDNHNFYANGILVHNKI